MLRVTGNAPYAVALDGGRHLQPGESVEVSDSRRLRALESAGLVTIQEIPSRRVAAPRSVEKPTPAPEED